MNTNIAQLVEDKELFKQLTLEEQLTVIADLQLFCSEQESDRMEESDKIGAKRWKDRAKYWTAVNQNIKKLAELQVADRRLG